MEIKSNFTVNIKWSFQDRDNLYLVLDLLTGGDLRFHLCYQKRFTEEQTKCFAACIILALEAIHKKKYIHRDLKPENLVFDENGRLKLTDFGIARRVRPDNEKETSGTPGYMAPEVMCRQPHSFEVDYFALGVILFECMLGKRPYNGKSRKEIRDQVLARQVLIRPEDLPKGWTEDSLSFINGLIQRKPSRRLGANGICEIKNHSFFNNFNWEDFSKMKINCPFKPQVADVFDYLRSLTEEETEEEEGYTDIELKIGEKSFQGEVNRKLQRL